MGEEILYHATTLEIEGDFLTPVYTEDLSRNFGHMVFAATELTSLSYSLKDNSNSACLWQTHWEINGLPHVVMKHRENLPNHPLATIYPIEGHDFEKVKLWDGTDSWEWTSLKPAKVFKEDAFKPSGIEEIMEKGVQLFFLDDSITTQDWHGVLLDISKGFSDKKQFHGIELQPISPAANVSEFNARYLQLVREMLGRGLIVHENSERDLSPANLFTGNLEDKALKQNWLEGLAQQAKLGRNIRE